MKFVLMSLTDARRDRIIRCMHQGEELRKERKAAGISGPQVARALKITASAIAHTEARSTLQPGTVERYRRALSMCIAARLPKDQDVGRMVGLVLIEVGQSLVGAGADGN